MKIWLQIKWADLKMRRLFFGSFATSGKIMICHFDLLFRNTYRNAIEDLCWAIIQKECKDTSDNKKPFKTRINGKVL